MRALLTALALFSAPSWAGDAPLPSPDQFYDRHALEKFLKHRVTRGDGSFPNSMPRGNWIKYCTGVGCQIKIGFTFSKEQIVRVASFMQTKRQEYGCLDDTPQCERKGLQWAMRLMDRIVKENKLDRMSFEQTVKASVMRDNNREDPTKFFDDIHPEQQFTRDCVDQAANGNSFIIVLANNGLIAHHKVVEPGLIHVPNPHWFTQIRELESGRTFRFDLYRTPRDSFGFDKLPGIQER
jgi:hypothetical protein